jgi:hypothetical protein
MFFIEDKEIEYRIDKEDFGCSIRGKGLYIEGNDMVYIILSAYSENKAINALTTKLAQDQKFSKDDINEVLASITQQFKEAEIFQEFCTAVDEFLLNTEGED